MTLPCGAGGATTQQVGYFAASVDVIARWVADGLDGHWTTRSPRWSAMADAVGVLRDEKDASVYACVPVAGWTAMLTSGPLGTDVGVLPSYAARELGCRAIRVARIDDDAIYPARILEVFGPRGEPPLALERSIVAANDGGRWVFETSGHPFAFEDVDAYQRRVKATRFTVEMLDEYLVALGVPLGTEPDWQGSLLVERRP